MNKEQIAKAWRSPQFKGAVTRAIFSISYCLGMGVSLFYREPVYACFFALMLIWCEITHIVDILREQAKRTSHEQTN